MVPPIPLDTNAKNVSGPILAVIVSVLPQLQGSQERSSLYILGFIIAHLLLVWCVIGFVFPGSLTCLLYLSAEMTGSSHMLPMRFEGQLRMQMRQQQRLVCPVKMPSCRIRVFSKVHFLGSIMIDDWAKNSSNPVASSTKGSQPPSL